MHGDIKIEFINSFSGKETVRVNNQIVSEKSSIMGTIHRFEMVTNGSTKKYSLRTKLGGATMVMIDLLCDRNYLLQNEPVPYGSPGPGINKELQAGLKKLRMFDLQAAVALFDRALDADPYNPQLHFYKACAHSLLEEKKEAFHHLQLAIDKGLVDRGKILSEDGLAFIRISEEFEGFCIRNKIELPSY